MNQHAIQHPMSFKRLEQISNDNGYHLVEFARVTVSRVYRFKNYKTKQNKVFFLMNRSK